MKKTDKNKGFSLLEIIISLAILVILSSTVFLWFANYQKQADLDSNVKTIIISLREAQSRSVSGKDFKKWGIYFDQTENKYILFRDEGSGYGDGSGIITKEEYFLSSFVKIENVSLNGGGREILFEKNSGETNQFGTIRIRDAGNSNFYIDINISKVGLISD